jgi:hypothetical protein
MKKKSGFIVDRKKLESHGFCGTRVYRAYASMRNRCLNKNHKSFDRYGGRGIKICERWLNSFENFYKDMGEIPQSKERMALERIDNNKGYYPKNCKWATYTEQNRNRSFCKLFIGRSIKDWCDFLKISRRSFGRLIKKGIIK